MENITQQDFERYPTSILKITCGQCKKEFYIHTWYYNSLMKDNKGRGLFCSKTCAQTGRPVSEETIEKIRSSQIGIPRPQSGLSNEKHSQWKGDEVKRNALHRWIRRHFPPPKECADCNQEKKLDLANTGIYNRDFKNWKYLCPSCHKQYDYKNGLRRHPSEETIEKIRLGNLRYQLAKRRNDSATSP